MGINKSDAATSGVKALAHRALESEKGLEIECDTHALALRLRANFNSMRFHDRRTNTKVYPPGDPMHGKSIYDSLDTYVKDKVFLLRTTDATMATLKIKDIATEEVINPEDLT